MFDEVSTELDKCKQAFTKASQSNAELHKAMDLHIQNLKLLASPLDEIKAALPSPQSVLGEWLDYWLRNCYNSSAPL